MYYSDGAVCIENCYINTTGDAVLTGVTLMAGTVQLFAGDLTIWAHTRTHPFWIVQPTVKASPDLSMFPKLGAGGETVDLLAEFLKADNGPMGRSLWTAAMANTGERQDLGEIDGFDAIYLKNPTADNATVVRGLSDAACSFQFHGIDPATQKMVSLAGNPKISYLGQIDGQYGNAVPKITSACPQNINEAAAHAPTFCALAAAIFVTEYDREELALWANYVGGLWQNWEYRLPCGYAKATYGQTRGKGRSLTTVAYAAKLSDNPTYFETWLHDGGTDASAHWPAQTGIQIDQNNAVYFDNKGFAPYQQHILIASMGQAIQAGASEYQGAFDYFCTYLFDSMLEAQHEFATAYQVRYKDDTGAIATDWKQALEFTAVHDPLLTAAMAQAEGSQALQDALQRKDVHQAGDFIGYPTSPTGFPAIMQPALAYAAMFATDQTRAQAAWAKFKQWQRIDYISNPKYNIVPRA